MGRDWADLQDEIEGQAIPGTLAGTYNLTGIWDFTGVLKDGGNALTFGGAVTTVGALTTGAAFTVGAKAVTITEAGGTGTLLIGTEAFLMTTA